MNAYNFPENVPITDYARDLVTKILNNDPGKRPSIDEILAHEWINNAGTIPRLLPASTLACPPSSTYIRQFVPNNTVKMGIGAPSATAPIRPNDLASGRRPTDNPVSAGNNFRPNQMPSAGFQQQPKDNEVWVKKWVDYSTKYGLGYCLSNEATGVFFNDSTKICLDPNGFHFDYMERRSADRQDVGKEYTLTEYPKDLQKKVTLL